ncbi:MAG: hypothetical protein H6953_09830 [Chromatiaceae bacterium]|nr:hypothetical protein [Gammaproteobacteria bacterium]MCP5305737.1 hypothetical protein [Chromatiaceae bacterium]MCP5312594.1 hypothetical protein [Chromatiaceae bacterium]
MSDDNVLPFPDRMRDAIDEEKWRALQGEFYLDCYMAQHGQPAEDPEQLRTWLEQAQLFAELENPFFRGWLVRRLSEPVG